MILSPLYHWSPAVRRPGIAARGLVPGSGHTTSSEDFRAPYVCLSTSAGCAWAFSGAIVGFAGQTWDLWQVELADGDEVHIRPDYGPKVVEVRVHNRIPKSRLWHVGSRVVESVMVKAHRRPPW